MANQQGTAQTIITPHYYWVQQEFTRLRNKLEAAFEAPSLPMGLEIVDGKSALKIWEQGLLKNTRRLPSLLRSFSITILEGSRQPTQIHTQRALIPLAQEVNRLIALHRQIWQQPLSQDLQKGQALLSRCLEKIAADLDDLFTFFITSLKACANEPEQTPTTHVWDREICCRSEMAAYKSWWRGVAQPTTPTHSLIGLFHLVQRLMGRTETRNALFCRA